MTKYAIPEYATSTDVKRIRKLLNMSQNEFSKLIGCSKPTIERWEKNDSKITGPIVMLLNMIDNNVDYIEKIKIPKKEYPLRLFYMYEQTICTMIDVNEIKRDVRIKNFTDKIFFRAFGNNEHPTYEDYQEFLKSRCFPETRDKLKLVLNDLNLPFYDPFMIIEKTEGRMEEDSFWIRIEV